MSDKTKPVSIRLRKSEIDQLQARAYTLSASISGVARDMIRVGLTGGDNKALADRLMRIERRIATPRSSRLTNSMAQGSTSAALKGTSWATSPKHQPTRR
jgi:hypothetical protein